MGRKHIIRLCCIFALLPVAAGCEKVPVNPPPGSYPYYGDNDSGYVPPGQYPYYGDNDGGYVPPSNNELLDLNDDL